MIAVDNLTRYYGNRAAVEGVSFSIGTGQIVGLLGLNGAGKTTTLKMLACVLLPTSGRVVIDGLEFATAPGEVRRRIGYLPELPPLYDEMQVATYLQFACALRGVTGAVSVRRVEEVMELLALTSRRREPIFALSHGFRQRVGVAQALVHQPTFLILDEPTGGLDPVQVAEMRTTIRQLKERHTVLVSSHLLNEISQVCDRCLVLHGGKLIAQGTVSELAFAAGGAFAIDIELAAAVPNAVALVKAIAGVGNVASADDGLRLRVTASRDVRAEVATTLVAAGAQLQRLDGASAGLEAAFLRLTSREAVTP